MLDDDRLKQGETVFGKDYFRELLDRVRSIRASERRIWQQITDIFAECSFDYDRDSPVTKDFYGMVQNKFHFAITGQTAAEIIHTKADKRQDNMGLQTWKRELQRFYKKIEKRKELKRLDVLIGISVNIAFKNPRTYPVVSASLSKLLELSEDSAGIIEKIRKRFTKLPNTEHLDLWMQRITLKIERDFSYQGKLCKKVAGNNIEIWCSDWLKDDLKTIISSSVIIDQEEIEKMKPVIESEEVAIFQQY